MITGHQGALDGIRAIAAFAVLITHVAGETGYSLRGNPVSWITARGDVGVPIFFTLSGLLLYRPWARAVLEARSWPSVRSYLWRRALRILPVYWVVVLIALPTLSPGHVRSTWSWIQQLFLVQIYDPHPWWAGTGPRGLAQMWSLSTEVSFYLALPVIALVLTRIACLGRAPARTRAWRLIGGIAAMAASSYIFLIFTYYPSAEFWLGETLGHALTWFAPGMALAVITVWAQIEPGPDGPVRRFCRTVAASSGACWLIMILAFVIACTPVAGPEGFGFSTLWDSEIKTALYTIVAGALVAPMALMSARKTRAGRVLGHRSMRFLGKVSYGVYLWQFLVIIAFFNVLKLKDVFHGGTYSGLDVIVLLVVISLLTVLVSTVAYKIVEEPAQRLYRLVPARSEPRHARLRHEVESPPEPQPVPTRR